LAKHKKQRRRDDKSKRQRFKRHTNWHHVYPVSRFKMKKDPVLHTAWHDVFQNKTPEDAIEKVEKWIANPEKFDEEIACNAGRINAWKMVFGDSAIPSSEVIKIIEKEWTFPGVKMIKTKRT
jgi:hypothetical protein